MNDPAPGAGNSPERNTIATATVACGAPKGSERAHLLDEALDRLDQAFDAAVSHRGGSAVAHACRRRCPHRRRLRGDGDLDLAVANQGSNDVTILINERRDGGASAKHLSGGRGPRSATRDATAQRRGV